MIALWNHHPFGKSIIGMKDRKNIWGGQVGLNISPL